jgi:hypothetical protein
MLVRGVALPAPIIGPAVLMIGASVEITCIPTLQRKMIKHAKIEKNRYSKIIQTDSYISHYSQPICNFQYQMNNCEQLQHQAYQPTDHQEK